VYISRTLIYSFSIIFQALNLTEQPRILQKWFSRGYVFVIALGVIQMFSREAIAGHDENLLMNISISVWLIVGAGIVWGIINLWVSSIFVPSEWKRRAGAFQRLLTHSFLFFILMATILMFSATPIAYWVAPSDTKSTEHVEQDFLGYSFLMGIFSIVLAMPVLFFSIRSLQPRLPSYVKCKGWSEG